MSYELVRQQRASEGHKITSDENRDVHAKETSIQPDLENADRGFKPPLDIWAEKPINRRKSADE